MTKFNLKNICSDLIKNLPAKGQEVISRRFGLAGGKRETLEAVGQNYGITRERVRQIQEVTMAKVKEGLPKCQSVLSDFEGVIRANGGFKREDMLLDELGGTANQNQVFFLLTLGEQFFRFFDSDEFHTFWSMDEKPIDSLRRKVNSFNRFLKGHKKPVSLQDAAIKKVIDKKLPSQHLESYLEISKKVQSNKDNLWGLKEWPEINPRGIRDKALLAFKKEQKPLHFSEVAQLIGNNANMQSVHNELIRDERFVLVGRGLYALKEMGYKPGIVKDVIVDILKQAKKPLTQKEIVDEVLKQRMVKENTVMINLNDKRFFAKNQEGKYAFVKGVSLI